MGTLVDREVINGAIREFGQALEVGLTAGDTRPRESWTGKGKLLSSVGIISL
jgi:hypothetical protein